MTYTNPLTIPTISGFTPPTVGTGINTAANYLAATAPTITSTTPQLGRLANLFTGTGPLVGRGPAWLVGKAAVPASEGVAAEAATMGAGRLFAPAAIGQAATWGINKVLPTEGTAGTVRQSLADAATMAGIGGTIGSFVAPGPGTLIGAGAGAVAGGAYGLLDSLFGEEKGKSKGDLRDMIGGTAKAYGFNDEVYKQRFDLAVKAAPKDAQGNPVPQEQIAAQMADMLIAQHQQELQSKEQMGWQQAQHQADLQAGLALQSQARDFFSPYTNNIVAAGQSQADVLNHLADQVPGAYKGVFQAQAASALNNAQQMAGAYAAQTALMPAQMAMAQTAQANSAEIANQAKLFQYVSQMQGRQGAGGGGTDIQSLLAQGGQFNQQAGV